MGDRVFYPPDRPVDLPQGLQPERTRPRAFEEWKALRSWGKLPACEHCIAGYLLRLAREEAGLSQRELASRLGVTQQAVAQAERWIANPTVSLMRRWAKACERSLELQLVSDPS